MKLECIENIAKVGAGQGAPQQENDFSDIGIPFIRAGSLEDLLAGSNELALPKINEEIAKKYKLKLYKSETIVFAKSGMSATKERIYKLKNSCYVVNHLATLELNSDVSPDFVFYVLKAFPPARLIKDPAYPSISLADISQFKIPFPSLSDQIRIAEILSQAEALMAQRKQSISLLDELLKSTFLEMFGKYFNDKYSVKLNDLCIKITDGTHDTPERLTDGIKFITGKHIRPFIIDYDNSDYVTNDVHQEIFKRCNPEFGDILYTNIGVNLGTAAMNIVKYEFSMKNVALLKLVQGKIHSRYLEHILNNERQKNKIINDNSSGGAQKFLSLGQIKSIKIPVPPMPVQTKFATIVEKVEVLKTQYQQSLTELQNMYGVLSQKAFKGELTPSSPALLPKEKGALASPNPSPVGRGIKGEGENANRKR